MSKKLSVTATIILAGGWDQLIFFEKARQGKQKNIKLITYWFFDYFKEINTTS